MQKSLIPCDSSRLHGPLAGQTVDTIHTHTYTERGPMPNVMAALLNIGGALCSTPQRLADAQYWSAMQ